MEIASRVRALGAFLVRYGLVVVLLWIGAMKFTSYEAQAIEPLVSNSPFLAWMYQILSVQAFSNALGVLEIAIGILIAARPISAMASAIGSLMAVGMFLTTLSFMITTSPTWEASTGGFPALSVAPGQFLLKDLVLLGAAIWSLGESLNGVNRKLAGAHRGDSGSPRLKTDPAPAP
jgi:uncharacterized membrane protein YkgB